MSGAQISAELYGQGPSVSVAKSGAYLLRANFNFDWLARFQSNGSACTFQVVASVGLSDESNNLNGGAPEYEAYVQGAGPLNESFNRTVSFPIIVPLTLGDVYSLQFILLGNINIYSNQGANGTATLSVGGPAGVARLASVTLEPVG